MLIPATVYTKEATVTHAKSGYKSFTGPDTWFLEQTSYKEVKRTTNSSYFSPSGTPTYWETYTADDFLSVGPSDSGNGTFNLLRLIDTVDPVTGAATQSIAYLSGYGVQRSRFIHYSNPSEETQMQFWKAFGDGTYDSYNSISFPTQTMADIMRDPYSSHYSTDNGAVRDVDTDVTSSEVTHSKSVSVRTREVKAHYPPPSSSDTFYEIEFFRTDTTVYDLKREFTDEMLLSIAISQLSSYGSESESLFMASSEMDYDADPHEITIVGTKYRLEVEVPIMDRPVTYFFRWETEDQNGNIILNSTAVSVPAGSDTATTEEFVFNPLSTNGEWNIVQAYAIPLPTGSSVIKQTPDRDSRPFKYRHQCRDYQALTKPPYLVIPVSWNLYAPAKSSMDEAFDTASGWSLGASRKTVYEEKFETPSLWSLGAPGYSYIWDETFSDSEGWGLSASGLIESSEETFANSDGWTLFSS